MFLIFFGPAIYAGQARHGQYWLFPRDVDAAEKAAAARLDSVRTFLQRLFLMGASSRLLRAAQSLPCLPSKNLRGETSNISAHYDAIKSITADITGQATPESAILLSGKLRHDISLASVSR